MEMSNVENGFCFVSTKYGLNIETKPNENKHESISMFRCVYRKSSAIPGRSFNKIHEYDRTEKHVQNIYMIRWPEIGKKTTKNSFLLSLRSQQKFSFCAVCRKVAIKINTLDVSLV